MRAAASSLWVSIACNGVHGMTQLPRLLRLCDVQKVTGLGKTTIYSLERKGEFPRRRKLSERASGWHEKEVLEWIESRPLARANQDEA